MVSVVIALIGIAIAFTMYMKNTELPEKFTAAFPTLHRAVYNKWYIDELYDYAFVNPCKAFGKFLWKGFDVVVVDGIVNGVANVVMGFSGVFRYMQSGYDSQLCLVDGLRCCGDAGLLRIQVNDTLQFDIKEHEFMSNLLSLTTFLPVLGVLLLLFIPKDSKECCATWLSLRQW